MTLDYISLIVAVIGLGMYVLAKPDAPKISRIGEILLFAGTLAFLLHLGPVHLFK